MDVACIVSTVLSDLRPYLLDGQRVDFDIVLMGDGPGSRARFSVIFDQKLFQEPDQEEPSEDSQDEGQE